MIAKLAKRGASFKGAGNYYLHDKDAQTSERVAWTETVNLRTHDPERALRVMAGTSMDREDDQGRGRHQGERPHFETRWCRPIRSPGIRMNSRPRRKCSQPREKA